MKKLGLVALLVVLTLITTPTIVQADPWSALSSGYAVTTVPFPQENVMPGDSVTAKAGTTDPEVNYVWFNWLAPDGTVWKDGPVFVDHWYPDLNYGTVYVYFSTYASIPPIVGDWGVQVEFYDEGGNLKGTADLPVGIIKIRATSFHAVPEVPIGTLTILLTMLASLAIFARKRF